MRHRYREPFPWRYAFIGAAVIALVILAASAIGVFR